MAGLEYANARIRARKGILLGRSELKIALEMKNVHDLAVWLEGTPYKEFITSKDTKGIETALFENWKSTAESILGFLPLNTHEFFSAYLSVFEVEAVKALVGSKASGTSPHGNYIAFLSRNLKKRTKAMLDAETPEALAEIFSRTDYGIIIKRCLAEGTDISMALDMHYFERLWNTANSLPSGYRKIAVKLVGAESDSANIINILRAKQSGAEAIPVIKAFHRFSRSAADACMRADGTEGALSVLSSTFYGSILDEARGRYEADKTLFHFEHALTMYRMKLYRSAMLDVLGIGLPIAYLKLKEWELRHLRTIALGLENGLSRKEIEEMLS